MNFPRFTSGEIGRLTFAHLNDLFARVESLEAEAKNPLAGMARRNRVITAKITGQPVPGTYSWVEVERTPTGWMDKPNGLTSSDDSVSPPNPIAYPVIGAVIEPAPVPIVIAPQYKQDGSLFYSPTAPGADGAAPYMVFSFTEKELGKSWLYGLRPQKIEVEDNAPKFVHDTLKPDVVGINGAENRTDPLMMVPTNDLYGVGWARPQGGYVQARNPIQIGIVVDAIPILGSSYWFFSKGNGYSTVCA